MNVRGEEGVSKMQEFFKDRRGVLVCLGSSSNEKIMFKLLYMGK